MRPGPPAFLAAALIVRDEEADLPECLASLAGVVDATYVYDTGSADRTVETAAELGARVTRGRWDDDFAAARNAAEQGWTTEWILSVDADHRCVVPDPARLRALLAATDADVCRVEIDNAHDELPYTHNEARIYRAGRVRWLGRVHERLVTPAGSRPHAVDLPRDAIVLDHRGYADRRQRVAKSVRNADLARRTLTEATSSDQVARTMLDLGRSLVGAGLLQDAVDTFESLRQLFPRTSQWLQATDFLARVVLAAGMDDICLGLTEQLRVAGAPKPYCDWLAAQALAQLGDVATAAALLEGVAEVVDTAGRRPDPRVLVELRELVGRLVVAASEAGPRLSSTAEDRLNELAESELQQSGWAGTEA
ncbi:MAG TPA: glycosyltransferase [Actinoplanes sp.]